ncbi:MAG: PAS domain-containing protein, partial [Desulfovibrionaceae bacterium]
MRRALGALPPILLAAFLLVLALSAPAWADPEDPAKPAESTTTAPTPQLRRFSPYAWPVLGLLAGQALAIALLVRAMRRRDRAERDRSASEQRYTDLLHSMLDGWGLSDMEGRTLQWNPAMRDMLGYTDQEMPLLTARHYTPPEDLEREIRDVLPQVLRRGYSDIYEKRVLHKTGRELHVELRVHLARDPEGRPAGIWSVVRDITARKRAEVELQRTYAEMEERVRTATAALETSQARLKAVLESTDDFIWAAETSGRVNYFNSAIHAHFLKHFNADLSQDDNPLGHLPPEKRALWQSVMRRCLAGESILNEYQLTNGQFVEIIANPIRDREGITGVSFFGRDVSERRRTRSRLRQTLAEVEAIFANSMVGILMVDGDRKVVRCNQRLAEILGYAHPGELEGKSARDSHLDDEHFDRFGQECYPPLRSMDRLHVDFPLRRRDGATVWCTLSGRAVDGKVPADLDKGVIWVVDDITTRRQSEQALRESEARFRAVVEGSPLAMSIVGPEERLEYINPRYVEMLGYPPEEIPDLPALRERVYPDPTYRQESYELLEAARNQLREGAPQGMMERRMVCRDGRALDVEFRFIDMGRDRILATLLDVTDRRRAEQLREDIDRIL